MRQTSPTGPGAATDRRVLFLTALRFMVVLPNALNEQDNRPSHPSADKTNVQTTLTV